MQTFIFGAGASMDYGYPSGEGLLASIKNEFDPHAHSRFSLKLFPSHSRYKETKTGHITLINFLKPLILEIGVDNKTLELFGNLITHTKAPSIDVFLAKESNEEFDKIGKLFMVVILACSEINYPDKWYNLMLTKIYTHQKNFDFSNYRFLTFNYDRSFECIIFEYILTYYLLKNPENPNEAYSQSCFDFEKFQITHLYGSYLPLNLNQFGNYEDFSNKYLKYGKLRNLILTDSNGTSEFLKQALSKISTVFSGKLSTEQGSSIAYDLINSESMFFIGCGFHEMNIKLLDGLKFANTPFGNFQTNSNHKYVCSHGLSVSKMQYAKTIMSNVEFSEKELKAEQFFREYIL